MAKLFYFDGDEVKTKEVTPKNPEEGFTLKELYAMLDCDLIEIFHINDEEMFVCDEEFRLKEGWQERWNAPANQYVTNTCHRYFNLCGNVLICKLEDVK